MASLVEQALAASVSGAKSEAMKIDFGRIAEESERLKGEVNCFLRNKYEEFDAWLDKTTALYQRVAQLNDSMKSTNVLIKHEPGTDMDASSQIEKVEQTLQVLTVLLQFDVCLQKCKDNLDEMLFGEACANLSEITQLLQKLETYPDLKITKALGDEVILTRESIKNAMTEHWKKLVIINRVEDDWSESKILLVKLDLSDNKLADLVSSFDIDDMTRSRMTAATHQLMEVLITAAEWITNYPSTTVEVEKKNERVDIKISRNTNSRPTPVVPQKAFPLFGCLFDSFNKLLSLSLNKNNSRKLMDIVRLKCSEQVIQKIIKNTLAPSVPTQQEELESYKTTITYTEKFEKRMKQFGFVQSESFPLTSQMENLNVLFANKKCQQVLSRARQLMKSDLHNSIQLEPGDSSQTWSQFVAARDIGEDTEGADVETKISRLSENTLKFPQCAISKSIVDLMDLAHEMMREACSSKTAQCAHQIVYSVRDMFELYTSVVPEYHSNNIENIPQVAALYYNNCMYLSHQLITLANQYHNQLTKVMSDYSMVTFVDLVPLLRSLGTNAFMDQLSIQKDNLSECLHSAQGFKEVERTERFQSARQSVKQCIHQLQLLKRVWMDTLPHSNFCKSIGHLLTYVLKRIVESVLILEDLSETDALNLYKLMSQIKESAVTVFPGDKSTAQSHLLKHASFYTKFTELHIVLNASLHEILDRWADGKGPLSVHFSADQVKSLVRALFQNTERRADALGKIR